MEVLEWDMEFHNLMLNDSVRMQSFKKAIFEVVKRGDVVCDLGTGTGVLAEWAFEAGASKVYGIDFNQKMVDIAKDKLSKFDDKFIPLLGNSLDIELPEKVDVLISETIGNFADNENCVEFLKDAKQRFLKTDGMMIPSTLEQMLVPVHSSKLAESIQSQKSLNYYETVIPKGDYLSDSILVNKFDFEKNNPSEYDKKFIIQLNRNNSITGFKGWFVAQLSPSVILNTEEVGEDSSWNHFYYPIKEIHIDKEIQISIRRDRNSNYLITTEDIWNQ